MTAGATLSSLLEFADGDQLLVLLEAENLLKVLEHHGRDREALKRELAGGASPGTLLLAVFREGHAADALIARLPPGTLERVKAQKPQKASAAPNTPAVTWARLGFVLIVGVAACGGHAWPTLLTTTVHRVEEQGIDYVADGTSTLEITLGSDGRGRAIRVTHGVDVLESDVHTTDDTAVYEVLARQEIEGFTLVLTPEAGQSPLVTPVELSCVPWTSTSRAEVGDATGPSLPGVEWVCELEGDRIFSLGRVVIQHVPREGAFILFGSSNQLVIEENINGAFRTVTTVSGPPR